MILTVVGSGTLVPHPRRSTPALALGEGAFQATVDGGSGTLRRQAELGIDFRRTHTLCFTHIHPDHTLDLLHFLFASKYTPGFERVDPVRVVGPVGFGAFLERLRDGYRGWTDGGDAGIEIVELAGGDRLQVGPLAVEAARMDHTVTDLGYRFRAPGGGCAVFTGDTGWSDALVELARDADLLVSECSGDEAHPAPGHLTAPEVGRLAAAARVGQVVLTHLYPLSDDRIRVSQVAAAFDGPVHLAADGDRFVV